MNERLSEPSADDSGRRFSRAVLTLVALLAIEALGLAALAVVLLVDLITGEPSSYLAAIALFVLTAAAAAGVGAIAVNALRGSSWIRGAAVTVQVLQLTVAIGSFQGVFARPEVGWLLLVPEVAILVLLFTRSVIAHTMRREG